MKKYLLLFLISLLTTTSAYAAINGFVLKNDTCGFVDDGADFFLERDCLAISLYGSPFTYFKNTEGDYKGSSLNNYGGTPGWSTSFAYFLYNGDCIPAASDFNNLYFPTYESRYDSMFINNIGYASYSTCLLDNTIATTSAYLKVNNTIIKNTPKVDCIENCNSNIVFIPGLMGSRLYEDISDNSLCLIDECYQKRWLPLADNDIRSLYLKGDGTSVSSKIFTKDVVDSAFGAKPLYKSFLDDMASWKSSGLVQDATSTPYDWRLSIDDVVNNGVRVGDGYISYNMAPTNGDNPYILDTIIKSAQNSRTGKVTIVAHSNGGLVAKAIMQKLRDLGREDIVDNLILVASPQVGTPDATVSLLHGSCLGTAYLPGSNFKLGCAISDPAETRTIAKNMPSAYHLLPSNEFFNTQFAQDAPPVAFYGLANSVDASIYESEVKNPGLYREYLKGTDGRIDPTFNDIDSPAVANAYLLNQSVTTHNLLDAWRPATSTKVIEVAGFGVYTISGLQYVTVNECTKSLTGGCTYTPKSSVNEQLTINGDETVVSPSAHYLSTKSGDIDRWYLDLQTDKYTHKDILEVPELRDFIRNILTKTTSTYSALANSDTPPTSTKEWYFARIHSPLNIHLYDIYGNHTGLTEDGLLETNIPGSQYFESGTVKTVIAPKSNLDKVILDAYDEGSFTIDQETRVGDSITSSSSVQAIPNEASTVASIILNQQNLVESPINVDFDGNGTIDATINPTVGKTEIYDNTSPELSVSFSSSTKSFVFGALDNLDNNPSIQISPTKITLDDDQGNTTTIDYKIKQEGKSIKIDIYKITRNNIPVQANIKLKLEYSQEPKTNIIKELEYTVTVDNIEKYKIKYQKEKDITTIKSLGVSINKQGLDLPTFVTNQNSIIIK